MTTPFVRPAARLLAALQWRGSREHRAPDEPPVGGVCRTSPAGRGPGTPDIWLAALRLGR